MDISAKKQVLCDECRTSIDAKGADKGEYIQATLSDGKDKTKSLDFCSENCLRLYLNGRARKKQSKASLDLFEIKSNKKN
jgi:hypothetical protein